MFLIKSKLTYSYAPFPQVITLFSCCKPSKNTKLNLITMAFHICIEGIRIWGKFGDESCGSWHTLERKEKAAESGNQKKCILIFLKFPHGLVKPVFMWCCGASGGDIVQSILVLFSFTKYFVFRTLCSYLQLSE